METNKIDRKTGYAFIQSEYGVFSDQYKKYQSLKGAKAVEYLYSIGFNPDRTTWKWVTYTEKFYK